MQINFKSTPLNFRNEFFGLKRNTIRELEDVEDVRLQILNDFYNGLKTNVQIEITNTETNEYFTRQITNVTKFKGLWIISW